MSGTRTTRLGIFLTLFYFAGELPKELRNLINLKELNISFNKFGGRLSIRTERFRNLLTFQFLGMRTAQGTRQTFQFDQIYRRKQLAVRSVS